MSPEEPSLGTRNSDETRHSVESRQTAGFRYGFWTTALAVVVVDQWTKFLVVALLPTYREPIPVLPGVYLTHVKNTGAAFGHLSGAGWPLVLAAVVAVWGIVSYRARMLRRGETLHPFLTLGLALPLGGAVGNMIDRLRTGMVTDFIDLRWWPVFNIADSAITIGAVLLMGYFLFLQPSDGPEDHPERRPAGDTAAEADAV